MCWGVTPPVWGQEKGGLLEVPTFRLVDVPGQQAPAIGEQKGLEVLSGGGCGSVPAVAVVGGQRGCDSMVPKIAPPPPLHSQQGYLPLCCTAQAEQAGDGRVVVGHIAGAGVVAEAGMETRLAWVAAGRGGLVMGTSPRTPLGRASGPPTVGHRVARGIEVHEVGASPGACLHRGGDDAQPRGRRVLQQGP